MGGWGPLHQNGGRAPWPFLLARLTLRCCRAVALVCLAAREFAQVLLDEGLFRAFLFNRDLPGFAAFFHAHQLAGAFPEFIFPAVWMAFGFPHLIGALADMLAAGFVGIVEWIAHVLLSVVVAAERRWGAGVRLSIFRAGLRWFAMNFQRRVRSGPVIVQTCGIRGFSQLMSGV
jgi:hypothetical protein